MFCNVVKNDSFGSGLKNQMSKFSRTGYKFGGSKKGQNCPDYDRDYGFSKCPGCV